MTDVVISGTGLFTPEESVSNEELVKAFNEYVARYNKEHAEQIEAGELEPLQPSATDFIEKASGIKSRHVVDKAGIIDPEIMKPQIRTRGNDEPSILCEMAMDASRQALAAAGRRVEDVDAVLAACSNMPRPYPALAVEVQHFLGTNGFGFDMNVACASATFGIQTAVDMVRNGNAQCVLVASPEICSGHLNFRDRDSHFIFGDACTAVVVESKHEAAAPVQFQVLGTKLRTQFSNNIRNNFGFLNRAETEPRPEADRLFVQEGRKVFKEVVPLVSSMLLEQLSELGLAPDQVKRFWLHQANLGMNKLISKRVLGREASEQEAPVVLDEYANTSSAGSVIAFHKYHDDLEPGDIGVLCAFGAGYSAGSAVLQRL